MPYKYKDIWHQRMRELEKFQRDRKRAESTIRIYKQTLQRFWKILGEPNSPHDVPLETYRSIEKGLEKAGYMQNTIVGYLSKLHYFLKFAGYEKVSELFIVAENHPKENRVFLKKEEVASVREIAHNLGTKYELVYSLAVDNSLRRGDMRNITLEEAESLLNTRISYITQKGGRRRKLVLHKRTIPLLREFMREREEKLSKKGVTAEPYLFVNFSSGKRTTTNTIYSWIVKISNIAGIYFRPHDLRATFVRLHSQNGKSIQTIRSLAGHKSINTTLYYYCGTDIDAMMDAQDDL